MIFKRVLASPPDLQGSSTTGKEGGCGSGDRGLAGHRLGSPVPPSGAADGQAAPTDGRRGKPRGTALSGRLRKTSAELKNAPPLKNPTQT